MNYLPTYPDPNDNTRVRIFSVKNGCRKERYYMGRPPGFMVQCKSGILMNHIAHASCVQKKGEYHEYQPGEDLLI
jgi:hypothetical protein